MKNLVKLEQKYKIFGRWFHRSRVVIDAGFFCFRTPWMKHKQACFVYDFIIKVIENPNQQQHYSINTIANVMKN